MDYPIPISIKGKNYKSLGEQLFEGFDDLHRINIIIGRNNSGKSALLDLVKYVIKPYDEVLTSGHKGRPPEIQITKPLLEEEIRQVFRDNTSGGIIGMNHFQFGKDWIGKPITVSLGTNTAVFVDVNPSFSAENIKNEFGPKLAGVFVNPLKNRVFRRLRADRDINPEVDDTPNLTENGQGATNVIQNFISKANRNRSLVEVNLLNALNEIFNPDAFFKRISVRQLDNKAWEIFLDEENKGSIQLSASGSGLKTVILVLINILLMPVLTGRKLSECIFAFEELENNLHPGLQRRLLTHIRKIAIESQCCFIMTTHSNVIIDLFSKDEETQIIHVTHNGEFAQATRVKTYIENKGVLDDLDVRASDLLQANGIIWVEGPSDRLYFNRWVELWTGGQLKEGTHYQCVFYGGRLLFHLGAKNSEQQDTIDILNVNKNAVMLTDSDKKKGSDNINFTKQRLVKEIEGIGGKTWVTAGREVENYISKEAIWALFGSDKIPQVGQYDAFEGYLNQIKSGEGEKYLRGKVLFAEQVVPNLGKKELNGILDMKERMLQVVSEIKKWNNI